jgi:hypothetical protein
MFTDRTSEDGRISIDTDTQVDDLGLPIVFFAVVPDSFMDRDPDHTAESPSTRLADDAHLYPAFDRWSF